MTAIGCLLLAILSAAAGYRIGLTDGRRDALDEARGLP